MIGFSAILTGFLWFILVVLLMVFFLGLGFYIKEVRKYKYYFHLYDANNQLRSYWGKLKGELKRSELKEFVLIPSKSVLNIIRRHKLTIPKPDDKYIKRIRGNDYFVAGTYINNRFSAIDVEPTTDTFKRDTQHADLITSWDLIKNKEERANYSLEPNKWLNIIGWGMLSLVLIVGLVIVANMVSDSNERITMMNTKILDMQQKLQNSSLRFLDKQAVTLNDIVSRMERLQQTGTTTKQSISKTPPPDIKIQTNQTK